MSSAPATTPQPRVEDCPDKQILKCRFAYDPDYTPIFVFLISLIAILLLPRIIRLINKCVFSSKSPPRRPEELSVVVPGNQATTYRKSGCCECLRKKKAVVSVLDGGKKGSLVQSANRATLQADKDTLLSAPGTQRFYLKNLNDRNVNIANLETPNQSVIEDGTLSDEEEIRQAARQQSMHSTNRSLTKITIKRKAVN